MGMRTNLHVYQSGDSHFIASEPQDAADYVKKEGAGAPTLVSDNLWFSQEMLGFLRMISPEEAEQGGTFPGRCLYKVIAINMIVDQNLEWVVSAGNPPEALGTVSGESKNELWKGYPSYRVELLNSDACYTARALSQLVSDISKGQSK